MKDNVLNIIKSSNGKITTNGLISKTGLDVENLNKILKELKLDGKVLQTSNRYSIFPDYMHIGKISYTQSGNKVIFLNDNKIPLSSVFFNNVILNDTVSFYINENGEAEITSIIDRDIHEVTCEIFDTGKKKRLECFYKELDVSLPDEILKQFKDGDVIVVNIGMNNEGSHHCDCSFNRYMGNVHESNLDNRIIAANYGFTDEYSEEYLDEVNSISGEITEEEISKRKDLRDIPFVTIDCENAKDMDDGVYGYKLKNGGYRVYVTIADVSHYVKINSKIFERAYKLGNSCYINNFVIHMLHPILSNIICSLNPGDDKLTKTVIMDIDADGNILDFDICKSVIRSRKKMSYTSVDKLLVNGVVTPGYDEYKDTIKDLYGAALALEKKAIKDGRNFFPSNENIKEYNDFGDVTKVIDDKYDASPSERLVEFLMIAANHCVAKYIVSCCIPSCFRNHSSPSYDDIRLGIDAINREIDDKNKKIKLEQSLHNNPAATQTILKKLSAMKDEYPILASLLLCSMKLASYDTINDGHFALALDVYTHFTSPIRRLCDLLVHMILDLLLNEHELLEKIDFSKLEAFLKDACKQASMMERNADAAECAGDRLAIIKSMKNCIGCEYEAVVLSVGNFIRLKVNGIDCLIKYKNLSDDFDYDKKANKFYDKNNNKFLKLGVRVKVKLTRVNLNTRDIDVLILGIIDSKKLKKKQTI